MSDHDWVRVQAIRAALDAGQPIEPADLYWLCDACGESAPPTPRIFVMTPQLRLWLWAAGDSVLMPTTA